MRQTETTPELEAAGSATTMRRTETTPELEAAEIAWWQKFAEVEDRYCWVQPPAVQRTLRGHYVKQIIAQIPHGGRVLDLGCGTGWLSILLAKFGARSVLGLDFSAAQIDIAREQAAAQGVGDRVQFEVADAAKDQARREPFDVVVMHGFLHHLTTTEFREALEAARRLLKPDGRLLIFEPVRYPEGATPPRTKRLIARFEFLRRAVNRGMRWRVRRFSPEELRLRELIAQRQVGQYPFGPSPKEIPLEPDELPRLADGLFSIGERVRCMVMSHLLAQELLLMQVSQPFLGRLLALPLIPIAARIDRAILREEPMPGGWWIFEMFVCRPAPARGEGRADGAGSVDRASNS